MFKKITAMLLCLTLTAICAGCGKDEDSSSSSKAESSETESVTETITEAPTEAPTETVTEAPAEADAEVPESVSTEELTEILLDGKWTSGYITDEQGLIYNITDYCEATGIDPSTFDMSMEFSDDGTVILSSVDGEETGKYTIDGINVSLIDDSDGSEIALIYDTENEMLFMNLLGTGQVLIGFTIE